MREIKFRVWIGGEFRYWGFIKFPPCSKGISFCGLPTNNKDPMALEELRERSQQFTGLKDKDGKEIYEGDIVETTAFSIYPKNKDVFWSDNRGGFCVGSNLCGKRPENYCIINDKVARESYVVGNIHENPELLRSGKK
jgi:uncharacterized phage protein (TIGR01671 family)